MLSWSALSAVDHQEPPPRRRHTTLPRLGSCPDCTRPLGLRAMVPSKLWPAAPGSADAAPRLPLRPLPEGTGFAEFTTRTEIRGANQGVGDHANM
eukprot:7073023-Pyramimonas_sp.AAC.1